MLVFEAPPDFVFTLDPLTKVRLGQPIGVIASTDDADTEVAADDALGIDLDDDVILPGDHPHPVLQHPKGMSRCLSWHSTQFAQLLMHDSLAPII